jgi:hypothetical protein
LRRLEPCGPRIDDDDISAFEETLGTRLPFDYRAFLTDWNGGVPVPDAYRFGGFTTLISRFYSLNSSNVLHDLAMRRTALRDRVPPDLLPIAVDLATNQICLGISGDRTSHLYYVSLQRDAELAARRPQPIAISFALFVRDLFAMSGGVSA